MSAELKPSACTHCADCDPESIASCPKCGANCCDGCYAAHHEYTEKCWLLAIKTLRAENERLRKVAEVADGLAGEFELAVASRDRTGGMQVTPTGDFVSCAQLPSAVSRMRWWAREIRIALAALDPK